MHLGLVSNIKTICSCPQITTNLSSENCSYKCQNHPQQSFNMETTLSVVIITIIIIITEDWKNELFRYYLSHLHLSYILLILQIYTDTHTYTHTFKCVLSLVMRCLNIIY